jgi:hypothetical protein
LVKSKIISIVLILTLSFIGFTYLLVDSDEVAIADKGEVKEEDLVMYMFYPEIFKAIKQQYELDEDSSIGYGVENYKISENEESDFVGYYVLFDVKGFHQDNNENGLRTEIKDTLKFSVTVDEEAKIELIEYLSNGWK